ncbi:MAG: thiamine phosphate synthase [Gammaproteobacteria bacterium]|nr:thiamine phosphate synthase [Gammaproteobacteria bacterium]MDE2345579.1 thiamine phosphate synthase [Gammaproteobacteria bacterium]
MNAAETSLRGLYAITDDRLTPGDAMLPAVLSAIRGGARLVQYRDKSADLARRQHQARALLHACRQHEIALLINDDVELAYAIGADGVHLGESDMPVHEARARLGPHAIIGASCHASLELAVSAARAGADYVAFGSFFDTQSKPGAVRAPVSLLEAARRSLHLPICAIGGITPDNGASLVKAGASMIAVISGIFAQTEVAAAARRYALLFE